MGVNTFTLEITVSYHYLPALKDKTDKTRPLHTTIGIYAYAHYKDFTTIFYKKIMQVYGYI